MIEYILQKVATEPEQPASYLRIQKGAGPEIPGTRKYSDVFDFVETLETATLFKTLPEAEKFIGGGVLKVVPVSLILFQNAGRQLFPMPEQVEVIDGKRYSTEKSTRLYVYDSGHHHGNQCAVVEQLFVSPGGAYFLAGSGGASTEYAKKAGGSIGPGERIIPFTIDEAEAWLEKVKAYDVIERLFADMIVDA
ncbi:MAG: hypothetical protein HQK89_02235 [Nitrospirae bacterium]|nr:hypothetical protein [Nitrospirota bacterium]